MKDTLIVSLSLRFLRPAALVGCCLFTCSLTLGADADSRAAAGESETAEIEPADGAKEVAVAPKPFLDIPKSVFITDESADVRDPFFPKSRRRWGLPDSGSVLAVVPEEQLVARHVALRGITGFEGAKVALINGKTLVEGEEAPIKLPDDLGQLKIKVLKVSENAVEFVVVGKTNVYRKQLE